MYALALLLCRVTNGELRFDRDVKFSDVSKHELEQGRRYSIDYFNTIVETVEDNCKKYNIPVAKLKLTLRQTNRFNIIKDFVVDYYTISIFILLHLSLVF